jgi:hypothetical protein
MTIVVEDGTGKSTAESYISVADASTYFSARGNTSWAAITTDALREGYLRLATEYMTQMYRNRWQGARYTETQALDWPRTGVVRDSWQVDIDDVPIEVQRACAELALKASAGTLNPDLTQGVVSEKVGPIAVTYDHYSPQSPRYKAIEAMLAPYLSGGKGISVKLVRS